MNNNNREMLQQLIEIQGNTLACLQGIYAIGKSQCFTDVHYKMLEKIKEELNTMNNHLIKIANSL